MFHENFKTLRKDRGFSQEQLALRLNVVRQTISKWEQGLSVPDAEMLMEIAEVLNVQVSDLLGQEIKVEEKDKTAEKIAIGLFVLFIAAIWESWGETWHEFGRNLYHVFN